MNNVSLKEAVSTVRSGQRVYFQGAAMTPKSLINALCDRYQELENVELLQIHTEGEARYSMTPYVSAFKINTCFVASNIRNAVNDGNAHYIPIFLSEIHTLFRRNVLPLDVAFIQVSPPDLHGFCSLGTSNDITLAAIETAKVIVAQVNEYVPRTHGDGIVHASKIDYAVTCNTPLHTTTNALIEELEANIGAHVASLIEDGATLQMGIGTIPNAVLQNLGNHQRLGIHTELFSDGILPLVEKGVITGEDKVVKRGKIVTCFALGSQKLYDFVNENPSVHFKEAAYTNDTAIIRRNPKVTAINSAIEIDLTGQVCAESIGARHYSGVGGQMDFIRGASLSERGKPIFALPSLSPKGISKIVPFLKQGAAVTTTRAHVHYVVTEYGIADLYGKNLKQRAEALIKIAHPSVQEELSREAHNRFH